MIGMPTTRVRVQRFGPWSRLVTIGRSEASATGTLPPPGAVLVRRLSPNGLTAADLFAGGKVSRVASHVR